MGIEELVSIRSKFGPEETANRLEAEVRARGLTIFAHVDHAARAEVIGLPLRATELLVFGNAKNDTALMQMVQSIAVDLPLKALIWQDEMGSTWLSYTDPGWLARRHELDGRADTAMGSIRSLLEFLARTATGTA
jgi:uncharacterized protein (DUF302 family)